MKRNQKPLPGVGRAVTAVAVLGSLLNASAASATPIATAESINYGWPSTDPAAPANCRLNAIFDSGVANWRTAVSEKSVTLGTNDYTMFWTELADAEFNGTDSVNGNADSADLMLIATHGSTAGSQEQPTMVSFALTTASGDWNGNCSISTPDMAIGNNQAEFVDVFACDSARRGLFDSRAVMAHATRRLHQWHGFHGTMGVGTGTSTKLDDYIDDAFDGSAALAWVDNLTSPNHWGDGKDVCALSMTRGSSHDDARARALNESYDRGTSYSDPPEGVAKSWINYRCGCESPDGLTGALDC